MALRLALAVLAVLVIAVAIPVSGAADRSGAAAKCKRGYVAVKVNGKKRCRPLRTALPKPRTGDRALIALRKALSIDRSELRTRRGRRARPLPRRVTVATKRGRAKLLRALPKAVAMIHRLEERAAALPSRRARASAGRPCGGPGSAAPISETGKAGGGVGLQGSAGPNGEVGGVLTVPVNGFVIETTFIKCGTQFYYVAGCPKANGDAATSGSGRVTATIRTLKDGKLVSQQSTDWTYEDKLLGKVMKNAKLKYFDLTRKERSLTVATGGVVKAGTANRTVRVNMPSGSYDAARSSVSITGDAEIFKQDDLAASIKEAIEEYKAAQDGGSFLHTDGWATFERQRDPYCAKAVFTPASESRRLRKGAGEQVSFYAQGQDGGRASDAEWTLIDTHNATFPGSASGAAPNVNFTVSQTPLGDRVRMTVKFTSTAGVGKDSWTEPIDSATINHIAGTFSGSYRLTTIKGDSILSWTGNASFDRATPAIYGGAEGSYFVASGSYTITASGKDGSFVTACDQTGTKHFTLPPASGSFDVLSSVLGSFAPPYDYTIQAAPPGPQSMEVTRINCPPGAEEMEGTQTVTTYFAPAIDSQNHPRQSPDGIVYDGSFTDTQGGVTFAQSWSFRGTE